MERKVLSEEMVTKVLDKHMHLVDDVLNSMTVIKDAVLREDLHSVGQLALLGYAEGSTKDVDEDAFATEAVKAIRGEIEKCFCNKYDMKRFPRSEIEIFNNAVKKLNKGNLVYDIEANVLYKYGYITEDGLSAAQIANNKKLTCEEILESVVRDCQLQMYEFFEGTVDDKTMSIIKDYFDTTLEKREGVPFEELAEKYDCSVTYVDDIVSKAKEKLKELLGKQLPKEK